MSNMDDEEELRKDAPSVLPIDRRTIHQICSGQVVLNLATAMKELLENSLDAGAKSVDIKLKENGAELIEVSDDGHGVEPQNFEALTLKHHTSKIRDFSDLSAVETFGFRGEALSSLCALSNLSITTRHKSQMAGTKIEYDHSGRILSKTPCARQIGTTVTLTNLFSTLPVRHKEFQRNVKKEFVKLVHVLNGYCLISSSVRINCTNLIGKNKKMTIVSTTGGDQIRDNITCVFGAKQVQSLIPFKQMEPSEEELNEFNIPNSQSTLYEITGYISKVDHGLGRSTADRQFFYINKRPCDLLKVSRVVNEVYHMFNRHQYPFVMLDISLQRDAVDVNVTPDKRQVFMQEEKLLLAIIKSSLKRMFDTGTSSYEVNQKPLSQMNLSFIKNGKQTTENENNESDGLIARSLSVQTFPSLKSFKRPFSYIANDSDVNRKPKQAKLTNFSQETSISNCEGLNNSLELKSKDEISCESCAVFVCEKSQESRENIAKDASTVDVNLDDEVQIIKQEKEVQNLEAEERGSENFEMKHSNPDVIDLSIEPVKTSLVDGKSVQDNSESQGRITTVDVVLDDEVQITKQEKEVQNLEADDRESKNFEVEDSNSDVIGLSIEPVKTSLANGKSVQDNSESRGRGTSDKGIRTQRRNLKEIIKTRKTMHVDFNIEKLQNTGSSRMIQQNLERTARIFRAKISPENNTAAEDELTKNITKESFAEMEILGQFNLGFILTKLGEDLFIIDQHASDEKYNFEYQQKHTSLNSQKLIVPRNLDLTASGESVLIDNIEIFRKNGFEFEIDESAETTKKARLVSVPVSKNWTFGVEDVEELLFMLSDSPGVMCRPTRVRKMFASRACRMSIMVGTALTREQMRTVVNHMGEMEHPWNCPHGRPTMRHVINLSMIAGVKDD